MQQYLTSLQLVSYYWFKAEGLHAVPDIDHLLESFNYSLTVEDCSATVECSANQTEGNCIVLYGLDTSNQNFDKAFVPLNNSANLLLVRRSALYFIKITFMNVTLVGNFTSKTSNAE